jgi:predicted RNA-binding Zn ribbon-like protein
LQLQIQAHTFRLSELVGNHVVLDLVNTVNARDAEPIDWLDGYQRVLEWAALTGHFDQAVLAELGRMSTVEPDAGACALGRLRELRETFHDVLSASIRREAPPANTLARLEGLLKEAVGVACITVSGRAMRLELDVESSRLEYIRHELALRALELLQTFPPERTRICAGTKCGWLFIDQSKAGRRRWCDMATCGNAAKSRRHYRRTRGAKEGR